MDDGTFPYGPATRTDKGAGFYYRTRVVDLAAPRHSGVQRSRFIHGLIALWSGDWSLGPLPTMSEATEWAEEILAKRVDT